jgi:hypothetical protein
MRSKTYMTTLWREGNLCAIRVPFDPKQVFGKTRAPVKVTLNGYTYRSTIASMGGEPLIPLRKSHRDAAGLAGTETLRVRLELDEEKREVAAPPDLVKALEAVPSAWKNWQASSFTHQREYVEAVEAARRPETRARRIADCVEALRNPPRRTPRR